MNNDPSWTMMISQEVVQIIFYLFNVHCNTYRQWVAVRMKLGEIRDPPQMCLVVPPGSFSWTDTCHGQCPGTASLPPTIKPTWEEPTILCPQPESQVHLNISKWQTLQSPKMPTKMTFSQLLLTWVQKKYTMIMFKLNSYLLAHTWQPRPCHLDSPNLNKEKEEIEISLAFLYIF